MTTLINRLNKINLETLPEGVHKDGLGLSLLVKPNSRSWTLRARDANGKAVMRGLGSLEKVDLNRARQLRDQMLALFAQCPAELPSLPPQKPVRVMPTFRQVALEVITTQTEGRNARAVYNWNRSLMHHAAALHDMPIDTIRTADVKRVLDPIWLTQVPTARLVRRDIAKVFSAAIADEFIDRNPAAFADNLEHKMGRQKHKTAHHAAMPYADVPAYVAQLQERGTLTSLALAFTILTCVRNNEACKARWDDISADQVWTVRGKNTLVARIPLSAKAQEILAQVKTLSLIGRGDDAFVFPGKEDGHISKATMLKMLQDDRPGFTVHGFRSSFRTWGAEVSSIERDILEFCLHHIEGTRTELAYNRAECLEKRRAALEQWAAYVAPVTSRPRPTHLRVVA